MSRREIRYQVYWAPGGPRNLLGTYNTVDDILRDLTLETIESCWCLETSDLKDIIVEKEEVEIVETFGLDVNLPKKLVVKLVPKTDGEK